MEDDLSFELLTSKQILCSLQYVRVEAFKGGAVNGVVERVATSW